mgnify:FL=1
MRGATVVPSETMNNIPITIKINNAGIKKNFFLFKIYLDISIKNFIYSKLIFQITSGVFLISFNP